MKEIEREYDVVVVGSGAGGGMASYVLTKHGVTVLLLEAGRDYDPTTETPMFSVEADAPLNGAATPDKPLGFYNADISGGWDLPGEPYTVAAGTTFRWWRARMLGGRTNHWGRTTLRYGPYDFRTYTRDGIGTDWPISYEDLEPYYTRVEKLIGVFGAAEGIENSPDSPPGVLLPPPPFRTHERWVQMVLAKQAGLRLVSAHGATLTRPLNGRQACLFATSCARGCSIRATFQSPTVLLAPAKTTGRLKIRTRAIVYEIPLNKRGRASGVRYIDTETGARHFVRARAVVLAASACETARILLNSTSSLFPNGLANGSGQVGRNLTDSVVTPLVTAEIPALQGLPPFNDDGTSTIHAYVPWWGHRERATGRLRFATEYHVEPYGGRTMPSVQRFAGLPQPEGRLLYGQALRTAIRHEYGSKISFGAIGGMIPNPHCGCEIDPTVTDRWGIPVLRFRWKWGPHEIEQAQHAVAIMTEMLASMGGKPRVQMRPDGSLLAPGGQAFHEVGTARMGADAKHSVLNSFCQAWEVSNLYIADGASFAGHADKNPTNTIMALAWRASDHLVERFLRNEV